MKEPDGPIQPFPTPPLPSKSLALAGSPQVAPDLRLYPVSNVRETPARVTYRKVLHPAAQDRINLLDQLRDRLGLKASENRLELA